MPNPRSGVAQRKHTAQPGEDELHWQNRARCREHNPDLFFPDKGTPSGYARKICYTCEVRKPCLEYALNHRERHGIWGGLTEYQRHEVERGRRPL